MRNILLVIAYNSVVIFANAQTATITPSGTVTVCKGTTGLLSANTGTGYSYQWYWNDKIISGQTTSQLPVTKSGKYTIKISTPNGEVTSEPTIVNVVVRPKVIITYSNKTTDICATGSIELKAKLVNNDTYYYQWYKNGDLIQGANQQTYIATDAGSYRVTVYPYKNDKCLGSCDPVTVTNSCAK